MFVSGESKIIQCQGADVRMQDTPGLELSSCCPIDSASGVSIIYRLLLFKIELFHFKSAVPFFYTLQLREWDFNMLAHMPKNCRIGDGQKERKVR